MQQNSAKPRIGRPPTGQKPKRYFRMDDEGWTQVVSAAEVTGESASEYMRRVLLRDSARILRAQKTGS